MRILVVEDDRKVASFIQSGLQQEGHAVDVLHEGRGAGEQACAVDYDAVVLDLMLPGQSGFQVLRDIRARKAELPVIILTAKDSIDERVTGLDGGADDYMVKPFALAELSARLRALRSEEHTSELQSRPHLVCRLLLEKKKNELNRNRPGGPVAAPVLGNCMRAYLWRS